VSLADRGPSDELPTTVRAAIASRIDALPPASRPTLLAASVIGKHFWRGVLRAIDDVDGTDEALGALEARDLIRRESVSQVQDDAEFSFKHILIREVAYATLPRADRRRRHAAVRRSSKTRCRTEAGTSRGSLSTIGARPERTGRPFPT
jgi:predicted ATPase